MPDDKLQEKLVDYIQDAHAMEQNVITMLQSMISTTDDAFIRGQLEDHLHETEQQEVRLKHRLEELGETGSARKQAQVLAGGLFKGLADQFRGDKAGKNARDAYVTEHLEIAAYELLERLAQRAGDDATAALARQSCAEERAMAHLIEANWDRYIDLTLAENGIDAPPRAAGGLSAL